MAQRQAFAGAQQPPDDVATAKGETTEIELSRAQQAIARRVAESKATIPHLALQCDIDMHECAALRARLAPGSPLAGEARPAQERGEGALAGEAKETAPSYDAMLIKACALALREQPRANSSYRDGRLQLHSRVNVGWTLWVELDGAGGPTGHGRGRPTGDGAPVVPTLLDADLKPLREIARETGALAERVRAGSLSPPELSGATFTIASLGAFPVESFTGIISPPQVATLTAGAVELRPVAHAGAIVARHTMTATLACDARVLGGADGAAFLARVKQLLEEPAALAP
jgi:pyruvate dehydrogenase E2 component (dihydrolipoamide acetyltransferase)